MTSETEEIFANARPDRSLAETVVRFFLLAVTGCASGFLSTWWLSTLEDGIAFRWLPGALFGLWTVGVAWLPRGIAARRRVRRSWAWLLILFIGIAASYATAVATSIWLYQWLDRPSWISLDQFFLIAISGFVGGAVGGTGLVSLWSLIFPSAESWTMRAILIACAALLGVGLTTWDLEWVQDSLLFFVLWQGGMAISLASADTNWRRMVTAEPPVE